MTSASCLVPNTSSRRLGTEFLCPHPACPLSQSYRSYNDRRNRRRKVWRLLLFCGRVNAYSDVGRDWGRPSARTRLSLKQLYKKKAIKSDTRSLENFIRR